ncbi:MAG TPA: hypothetical protein VG604_03720 [Candidatus Saccharimonadales bacterium]|nr:hypothetical protein [Candidatus Saccharimonadales bacterium]
MAAETASLPADQRAHHLSSLSPEFTGAFVDLVGSIDPDQLNYGQVVDRGMSKQTGKGGLGNLYYGGLLVWQTVREQLQFVDPAAYFSQDQQDLIDHYCFRNSVMPTVDAFVQSALVSPVTFASWYSDALGIGAGEDRWERYSQMTSEQVQSILKTGWMARMLREGSKTSTGFYRNSTGIDLGFRSHVQRSVTKPLTLFQDENPDADAIEIEVEQDFTKLPPAHLSDSFKKFLAKRMRQHNKRARQPDFVPKQAHEGTSRGCPVAHDGKSEVDPYAASCNVLSQVVGRLAELRD